MKKKELRPVNVVRLDGVDKALFHEWYNSPPEVLRGAIEFADGTVKLIPYTNFAFTNNLKANLSNVTTKDNTDELKIEVLKGIPLIDKVLNMYLMDTRNRVFCIKANEHCTIADIEALILKNFKVKSIVTLDRTTSSQSSAIKHIDETDTRLFILVPKGVDIMPTLINRCDISI